MNSNMRSDNSNSSVEQMKSVCKNRKSSIENTTSPKKKDNSPRVAPHISDRIYLERFQKWAEAQDDFKVTKIFFNSRKYSLKDVVQSAWSGEDLGLLYLSSYIKTIDKF